MNTYLKLSVSACVALLISCQAAQAGTIGYWKFEEGPVNTVASGGNSLLDSSGNSLHMNPAGNPIYRAVPNPGSTLGLEFTNDLAFRNDGSQFQVSSFTIEAFIKYNGGGGLLSQIFFRGDSRAGLDPYYLGIYNGALRVNISDLSLDRALVASTPVPVGQYVHVAATLNDTTDEMKLYLNGVEIASQSAAGVRPDDPLFASAKVSIGALYDGAGVGQYFNGTIDEVRLSDVALTPDQFLYAPTPVPEPSSMVLMGLGGIALAGYTWHRKRQQAA